MTIRAKLEVIQKRLGLTQTKLAARFGVSFVALNNWWTGKATPRPKMRDAINALFLEVTGQKVIPQELLLAKKLALSRQSAQHKSIVAEILNNPDIRDQFVLSLTYHSNSIEGSTLTLPDTAAILFDNVVLPDKSLVEQLEAKNHQTALMYLFEHIRQNKEINEGFVLKLHGILMNSIRPDAGAYRRHGVRITGVKNLSSSSLGRCVKSEFSTHSSLDEVDLPTANYLRIPDLVPKVLGGIKKKTADVVALSASVHSRFEQIHPFSDGNGRVGRLLMNAMLLKAGFAPAVIEQERKQLYYTYLYKAQTKDDQSQLENFLCDAVSGGFRILERKDV